jgi:hypothetical protein
MEKLKGRVYSGHKPVFLFPPLNDTSITRISGPEKLKCFLNHLNSVHWSIQFTMETVGNHLFLEIDVYRISDISTT